jgi:hypothetical protein
MTDSTTDIHSPEYKKYLDSLSARELEKLWQNCPKNQRAFYQCAYRTRHHKPEPMPESLRGVKIIPY